MSNNYGHYPCPFCEQKGLESAATLPFVRGYLLAYQMGYRNVVGCKGCVRKQLLQETGKSMLIGWFSPTALVINPFLIVYGLGRTVFVTRNPNTVAKLLQEAGVPEPNEVYNMVDIAYNLATAMIMADNKVEPEEIKTAVEVGKNMFGDFDENAFRAVIDNHKNLPSPLDLAAILKEALEEEAKIAVCTYLMAIAAADGHIAPEEEKLIGKIRQRMGLS